MRVDFLVTYRIKCDLGTSIWHDTEGHDKFLWQYNAFNKGFININIHFSMGIERSTGSWMQLDVLVNIIKFNICFLFAGEIWSICYITKNQIKTPTKTQSILTIPVYLAEQ